MINTNDENLDGIDLDELFNDFDENQSSITGQSLTKWGLNSYSSQDDLTNFNEDDCTAPRIYKKRTKNRKITHTKQMTMYDYVSSVSYRHKQFYSSLDNKTTSKTITKEKKRSLMDSTHQPVVISKKSKTNEYVKSSLPSTPPDLIDNLLRYLDERSHNVIKYSVDEQNSLNKKDKLQKTDN
ncbi:hypothetical protein I4U23_008437 [Adineta vaga]|nr:hypothetical protein I4U23_008437 [Adineta vaga]